LRAVDFNIEGGPEDDLYCTDNNNASTCSGTVNLRNQAIKNLQVANPGLRVSFTLSVMHTTGLPTPELRLLQNAKANGVDVANVNISAMNYGPCGLDMGQAAIDAANQTIGQLNSVGLTAVKVGILPMIGTNDVTCETFTTEDAQQVVNWANPNSRIAQMAFWALGRDTASYDYLAIFEDFR
jgi:hypothetical protein